MSLGSVMAPELRRYHRGQKLALNAREGGLALHYRHIQLKTVTKHGWIQALDMNDVPHPSRPLDGLIEQPFEQAGRLINRNLPDPGHVHPLVVWFDRSQVACVGEARIIA